MRVFFLVGGRSHRRRALQLGNHVTLNCSGVKYQECGRTALWCRQSAEFLRKSDEKPLGTADVAEPIRVFILDYFAYELRAALAEPLERPVDVVHREHDA